MDNENKVHVIIPSGSVILSESKYGLEKGKVYSLEEIEKNLNGEESNKC